MAWQSTGWPVAVFEASTQITSEGELRLKSV
jgi:hypothetical protein